jgi:hypothetical protein
VLDLLAAAEVSHRDLVIPELSECAVDGYDRTFGGLFDVALPLTARVRSTGSFDFQSSCNGSAVYLEPGPWSGASGRVSFGGLDMPVLSLPGDVQPSAGDVVFGKAADSPLLAASKLFISTSEQKAGVVHREYFAKGQRDTFQNYRQDPLFLEKVASRPETCVVLGKNFQAANWERFPELFVRAVRALVPTPPVRAAALDFLWRHGLAGGSSSSSSSSSEDPEQGSSRDSRGCPLGRPELSDSLSSAQMKAALLPAAEGLSGWGSSAGGSSSSAGEHFLAIHLRMGDFLTDPGHQSFGVQCNAEPGKLIKVVKELLAEHSHVRRIVVATDDFSSACFLALQAEMGSALLTVRSGSGYRDSTCSAALFDQEVLGHGALFIGDQASSFSEAIHRVRTLRCGAPASSTVWL